MLYNFHYDVAAVMLTAMLILVLYVRRTFPSKSVTYYKWMLWLNLVSSLADIASCFLISFPDKFPMAMNYGVNITYLLAHNLTAVAFLLYVLVLIRGHEGTKGERIFWRTAIAFDVLALLTTPFTKLVFYFDEDLKYCHGPLMIGLYAAAFIILFYALILFLRHRHIMNSFQEVTNVTFLTLVIGAIVFQFFFTSVLIESFCGAIAFLMMNVALDNPNTFFYRTTYCYNQNAFNATLEEKAADDRDEFTVLSFTFDDLPLLRSRYGEKVFDELVRRVISMGLKTFGQKHFFLRSNACFSVLIEGKEYQAQLDKITHTLADFPEIAEGVPMPTPHFCVLGFPSFTKSVNEINVTINNIFFDVYPQSGERVIVASRDMLRKTQREAEILHRLRAAIANDGFDVYYQPIFEQRTGLNNGAEALVRLREQDPDDFVGPDEFIPIAEKNGLITEIGEIVLDKVCHLWHTKKLDTLGVRYIDVNLSIMQLEDQRSVERLEAVCIKRGVSPSHIRFEITETARVNESEHSSLLDHVNYLCSKGFSFSLDDYGSGYSTATYLAEMPFDVVKIDKNILWKAMKDKNFHIILTNLIHMIREFGKECVVEGVENDEMVKLLAALGCDYLQGYRYSRPIPEKEYVAYLKGDQL